MGLRIHMKVKSQFLFLLVLLVCLVSCKDQNTLNAQKKETTQSKLVDDIQTGALDFNSYKDALVGKRIGLVVNQTSMVKGDHLVDFLLSNGMDVKKIFAPEHGFRGKADAGEKIDNSIDQKTKLPIISLYGKHKKPTKSDFENLDVIVFDIQDVGVRFYTFISTLHYIMEAAAENGKAVIVLDRPNPNAHYIDGPILEKELTSFVGMHPVPVVYGMTIGEYAQMINGEQWLNNGMQCSLTVVECKNYSHSTRFDLPIKPSPNLPNELSILLYPSLCFFEGSTVSVGRGTDKQFQVYGHPEYSDKSFGFFPQVNEGAKYPKHEDKMCFGNNLTNLDIKELRQKGQLDLSYLLDAYANLKAQKIPFFNKNNFFEKLAGTNELRRQIKAVVSEEEIRVSWKEGIDEFKLVREKYLLYSD